MVSTLRAIVLACASTAACCAAWADDVGRARAQQACAVCHGPLGVSSAPDAPNLAGQPELYLASQLRAYRSGARRHEVMNVIAKPLTDDEIASLARWYQSIRIEARAPN